MHLLTLSAIIFTIAAVMSMTGRGGGNFYVIALVASGLPMHDSASTGQLILFSSAVAAALVFRKGKNLIAPLALFLGIITSAAAFLGGYAAQLFSGDKLKAVFALFLLVAGIAMFFKPTGKRPAGKLHSGLWSFENKGQMYGINPVVTIPVAAISGFFAGMVGVSGGSFLVPLMVLACGVPVHAAAGTASIIVAATALSGFVGHTLNSGFDFSQVGPLVIAAILGGLTGGKAALNTNPRFLRILFASTTLAAAGFMIINLLIT